MPDPRPPHNDSEPRELDPRRRRLLSHRNGTARLGAGLSELAPPRHTSTFNASR